MFESLDKTLSQNQLIEHPEGGRGGGRVSQDIEFGLVELGWLELIICMELFQAFLLNWILFPQLENHQQHAQHPLTTKPS